MKIVINNKNYEIEFFDEIIKKEITKMCPLKMIFQRYDEHEYYSDFKNIFKSINKTISNLLAGHIYYWSVGKTFVLNFKNFNITPYEAIHIGEIKDKKIIEYLQKANNSLEIKLEV